MEAAINSGVEKFETHDLLKKLCKKYKYKPETTEQKTQVRNKMVVAESEMNATTLALRAWFKKVKTNGRPGKASRIAMNYVITALLTSKPNVSALGRELQLSTDGKKRNTLRGIT